MSETKQSENEQGTSDLSPNPTAGASSPVVESEIVAYNSFENMELPMNLLRGVYAYGFEKPSMIQQHSIVPLSKGRDVIGQAQSGTGKTGAFVIGSLSRFVPNEKGPQIVIVSPTRELAEQTNKVVMGLTTKMEVKTHLLIGGTSVNQDVRDLGKNHPDVISGTPGRILDLIMRRALDMNHVKTFIIDEADEMLSAGFKTQIYEIFRELSKNAQVGIFSATLPPDVLELTKKFMNNPLKILVKTEELTLDGILQFYIAIDEEWKLDTLIDLYSTLVLKQTIIYVNSKRKCQWIASKLQGQGYTVSEIHANMTPKERKDVMASFISGATRILLTTDLLSRGIDIQQVSLIVNFDLPSSNESYLHRIGRSGRFGRKGIAINFVSPAEKDRLKQLTEFYSTEIKEMPNNIAELF